MPCFAGTIGDEFENNFRALSTGCFGKNSYTAQFLPPELIAHPMAKITNYKKINNTSFEALSTLVFYKQDLEEARTAPSNRSLKDNLEISEQNVTQNSLYSSLTYNFSCTSALKTALKAGLDINPGLSFFSKALDVHAGLNAELANDANTGLLLLYGRFRSPFSAMLQDTNPAIRLGAYSAIWKYYASTSPLPVKPTYLDFIEGWLVTSTTANSALRSLNADANVNLHAMLLNADWTNTASIKFNSTFKSQKFDIYVIPDDGSPPSYNYQMYLLPTPEELAAELEKDAIVYPADGMEVAVGQKTQLKIALPGLHDGLCNTPQWEISAPAPVIINSNNNTWDKEAKSCIISASMSLPPAAGGPATIPLKITNKSNKINNNNIFFTKNIRYTNSTYPIAHVSDLPKIQMIGDANIKITVDLPIAIETEPGTPAPNDVRVTSANLDCLPADVAKPQLPTAKALTYSYVHQPTPLLRSNFMYGKSDFPVAACVMTALIDFTYRDNMIQNKQISIPITLDQTTILRSN